MKTLHTERLTLRPLTPEDAPAVQEFVSDYDIALNTLTIPHPYPEGAAAAWIARHAGDYEQTGTVRYALIADGQLVGTMELGMKGDGIAEIGYWVGKPYWNRGYASEAARELVRYGFEECGLERIYAGHFGRNPASGKVMQKAGMRYEGTLRRHLKKWDEYVDLVFYGIVREDFVSRGR